MIHGEVATAAQAGHSAQELHASYRELAGSGGRITGRGKKIVRVNIF